MTSPKSDAMPQFWLDTFESKFGVPAWAALRAWDEADDDDTAMQIRLRAQEIAADPVSASR